MTPLFALLLLGAEPVDPIPRQWAEFARAGSLNHIRETVSIGTANRGRDDVFHYRLRYVRRTLGAPPVIRWADSRSCPAIRIMLQDMARLTMPTPVPYGVSSETAPITLDGTGYSLTAPSSFGGTVTIDSNVQTPLAQWVDRSLEQLASCWRDG